jgi:hypothetical protein
MFVSALRGGRLLLKEKEKKRKKANVQATC